MTGGAARVSRAVPEGSQRLLGGAPHDDSNHEDQERNTSQNTPNCVEPAPPSQQVRKFCSTRIQSWIEQTFVRWKNDDPNPNELRTTSNEYSFMLELRNITKTFGDVVANDNPDDLKSRFGH